MPIFIQHRVNKVQALRDVAVEFGVEIDLRSDLSKKGRIHLSHDAWVHGDDFETWAREFKACQIKGPIILNTKEDGLEERTEEIMKAAGLSNYFFLDTALPTLVRHTMRNTNKKFAVRLSQYEPAVLAQMFKGKLDWVWVDCFAGVPLPSSEVLRLKQDFKICLVSPELQGQSIESLSKFKELYALADAICTKKPHAWMANGW
jgi:hypothetical protein